MAIKPKKLGPREGSAVVWPSGVEKRYDISPPTRWRWEKDKRLPKRDVNVGGKTGWRPSTLDAADRENIPPPKPRTARSPTLEPRRSQDLTESGNSNIPDKSPPNVAVVGVPLDNLLQADFVDPARGGM